MADRDPAWNQTQLAEASGVNQATVSRVFTKADYDPGITVILAFARALGVEPGELLREPSGASGAGPNNRQPSVNWPQLFTDLAAAFVRAGAPHEHTRQQNRASGETEPGPDRPPRKRH